MTPKEKARELVINMQFTCCEDLSDKRCFKNAKQCALIAVDEIIGTGALGELWLSDKTDIQYWQEVKQEINQL